MKDAFLYSCGNSPERFKELIDAARGVAPADLVFKNATYLNVFTGVFETGNIAVKGGVIAGIGDYSGVSEVDCTGKVVCPGLIDGHIHIESSMISPSEFSKAVVPCGTTAVVTDPHEIANVAGTEGIRYMMENSKSVPLDVFFMLPSCVPATPLDEAGAVLDAYALRGLYEDPRVLGLAEMMNSYGTVRGDDSIVSKILDAKDHDRIVDGHAPGLSDMELNAYVAAGVKSDHECVSASEAIEKLKRGQWIMIRQGTAAKNLQALLPLFDDEYFSRCMLVTDDKHPGDLLTQGHIDYIVRSAIAYGKKPENAIRMATYNAATYFGLTDRGAIAPGYLADLIVVSDLSAFEVEKVYKAGKLVASDHSMRVDIPPFTKGAEDFPHVYSSFNLKELTSADFALRESGSKKRVIEMVPGELLTREVIVPANLSRASELAVDGHIVPSPGVETDKDIIKIAVIERHKNTGHVGVGFAKGYGIRYGAIASSVAHDSHNLIVAGTNDIDMAAAANAVRSNLGGLAIAVDGKVVCSLPLPLGGLMCDKDAAYVESQLSEMKEQARLMGVPSGIDPFMTLAFTALPVIPKMRILTKGMFDVDTQSYVPTVFD